MGIIPADAGSTGMTSRPSSSGQDHPRGCGEHPPQSMGTPMPLGSSPRMRGARMTAVVKPEDLRIIPADAGSTMLST